jgi:CubicO group peptidase (beta-lactamase class C family)
VAEHVFTPAGMTRSGFVRTDVVAPDVAEGVEVVDAGGAVGWRRNIYAYHQSVGPTAAHADGAVRGYWKEGVNVGLSGILRHYPTRDVTCAVLAVGENAAWRPVAAIDAAVRNMT